MRQPSLLELDGVRPCLQGEAQSVHWACSFGLISLIVLCKCHRGTLVCQSRVVAHLDLAEHSHSVMSLRMESSFILRTHATTYGLFDSGRPPHSRTISTHFGLQVTVTNISGLPILRTIDMASYTRIRAIIVVGSDTGLLGVLYMHAQGSSRQCTSYES